MNTIIYRLYATTIPYAILPADCFVVAKNATFLNLFCKKITFNLQRTYRDLKAVSTLLPGERIFKLSSKESRLVELNGIVPYVRRMLYF